MEEESKDEDKKEDKNVRKEVAVVVGRQAKLEHPGEGRQGVELEGTLCRIAI